MLTIFPSDKGPLTFRPSALQGLRGGSYAPVSGAPDVGAGGRSATARGFEDSSALNRGMRSTECHFGLFCRCIVDSVGILMSFDLKS